MATDKPKLQAYVSGQILEAILEYQNQNGYQSTSAALLSILEGFFGLSDSGEIHGGLLDRLEVIEQRLKKLESQANLDLLPPTGKSRESPADLPSDSPTAEGLSGFPAELTLTAICRHYGLSSQNFARNARLAGQTTLEYLCNKTGVSWVQRGKRYVQG